MILLQLNDISKSFDGEDIFNDVNVEIKTGERIGIVGMILGIFQKSKI